MAPPKTSLSKKPWLSRPFEQITNPEGLKSEFYGMEQTKREKNLKKHAVYYVTIKWLWGEVCSGLVKEHNFLAKHCMTRYGKLSAMASFMDK